MCLGLYKKALAFNKVKPHAKYIIVTVTVIIPHLQLLCKKHYFLCMDITYYYMYVYGLVPQSC